MDNIFLSKGGGKSGGGGNCGRPSGHNFGHPLDRKQTFFLWTASLKPLSLGLPVVNETSSKATCSDKYELPVE